MTKKTSIIFLGCLVEKLTLYKNSTVFQSQRIQNDALDLDDNRLCTLVTDSFPLRHDLQIQRLCDGTVSIDEKIYISKASYEAVPVRKGGIRVVTQAYGIDDKGSIWYNDIVYGNTVQHQSDHKLDLNEVSNSIGGRLSSKWTVTPHHNVLDTLDSIIGLKWTWKDLEGSIRYAPSYESQTFSPLNVFGPTGTGGNVGYHQKTGDEHTLVTEGQMGLLAEMVLQDPMVKMHGL